MASIKRCTCHTKVKEAQNVHLQSNRHKDCAIFNSKRIPDPVMQEIYIENKYLNKNHEYSEFTNYYSSIYYNVISL